MAKLPTTIRTDLQDVPNAPPWFSRFLSIQNTFNQAVYEASAGQLTFGENVRCIIKELPFTTMTTYSSDGWDDITFPNTLRTRATGLTLMQLYRPDDYDIIYDPTRVDWIDLNGEIVIRWVSGLENDTNYVMRVMVI